MIGVPWPANALPPGSGLGSASVRGSVGARFRVRVRVRVRVTVWVRGRVRVTVGVRARARSRVWLRVGAGFCTMAWLEP